MPSPLSRQTLAQRIHLLLEREIDHLILVERLLGDPLYARDVLLVCDALVGTPLPGLAAQFRASTLASAATGTTAQATPAGPAPLAGPPRALPQGLPSRSDRAAVPGHAALANAWGQDTSGFGLSQPALLVDQVADQAAGRLASRAAADLSPNHTAPAHPAAAADGEAKAPSVGPERRRGWLNRLRDL